MPSSPLKRATKIVCSYARKTSVGDDISSIFGDGYGWTTNDETNVKTCVTDILADLAVFCKAHDLEFDDLLTTALMHAEFET